MKTIINTFIDVERIKKIIATNPVESHYIHFYGILLSENRRQSISINSRMSCLFADEIHIFSSALQYECFIFYNEDKMIGISEASLENETTLLYIYIFKYKYQI